MNFIDLIIQNKLNEAKQAVFNTLDGLAKLHLEESKQFVADNIYGEFEEIDEANKSTNIVKMGRIKKIRRRIRRNAKGRIIVQRNVRKSAIKGYRISGSSVKRISAIQRINKSRKLKRYWKSKGRARLGRTLLKRRMSNLRRKSMGIK